MTADEACSLAVWRLKILTAHQSPTAIVVTDAAFVTRQRRNNLPKAYWVVRVSVRDEQGYPEYIAAVAAPFKKFDAKFIVRGGPFTTMEGTARERNVVVEFKDRATAMACYESPEYQSAKAIRQKYADADFIIIDGIAD
ncbi:MAG: DUF1330 domain-containing protein [Bradyrhizobium sp.]